MIETLLIIYAFGLITILIFNALGASRESQSTPLMTFVHKADSTNEAPVLVEFKSLAEEMTQIWGWCIPINFALCHKEVFLYWEDFLAKRYSKGS